MSIEIKPVGSSCSLRCSYCYLHETREQEGPKRPDMPALRQVIAGLTSHFSLFGGEALLTPLPDLDELLRLSYEKFGQSGVQTSATTITDAHIELFLKYHTHVGISIDGPGELNRARWAGSIEATDRMTDLTEATLYRLLELSQTHSCLGPSVITTLHKGNISKSAFPQFVEWIKTLDRKGLKHLNLHLLENDHQADSWAVDEKTLGDRLIDLWTLAPTLSTLKIGMFEEIERILQGNDKNAVCVYKNCDPYWTQAVEGYEHDGTRSGCGRLQKDGQHWLPAERHGYERQLALYVTPQDFGGCQDCTRWIVCRGNCPGTGIDSDWRYKTSHCAVLKRLFAHGEKLLLERGITPLPEWTDRKKIEDAMYLAWGRGENPSVEDITAQVRQTKCAPNNQRHGYHTDGPLYHADIPHGDSHADSTTNNR